MEIYHVALIGHRFIHCLDAVEKKLQDAVQSLLNTKQFVEFFIGNSGDFDRIATSVLRHAKKHFENACAINLVLPYKVADMDLLATQYDDIIIPHSALSVHPKRAFSERNRWMIEHSNLLLCYVTSSKGGAASAVAYATTQPHIVIQNLFC